MKENDDSEDEEEEEDDDNQKIKLNQIKKMFIQYQEKTDS